MMGDERQKRFNDAMCLACTSLRAELAATTAALEQWTDWFDCDSPHDTDANHSTVLGKEQRRANIAERQSRALAAHVEELRLALKLISGHMINSKWRSACDHWRRSCEEIGCSGEYFEAIESICVASLAATPVQSLNRVKAEALREAANLIQQTTPARTSQRDDYGSGKEDGRHYAVEQLENMAEALDSEPPATR